MLWSDYRFGGDGRVICVCDQGQYQHSSKPQYMQCHLTEATEHPLVSFLQFGEHTVGISEQIGSMVMCWIIMNDGKTLKKLHPPQPLPSTNKTI